MCDELDHLTNQELLEEAINQELVVYVDPEVTDSKELSNRLIRLEHLYQVRKVYSETDQENWSKAMDVTDRIIDVTKWAGSTLVVVTMFREGLKFEETGTLCSSFVKDLAKNATSIMRFIR